MFFKVIFMKYSFFLLFLIWSGLSANPANSFTDGYVQCEEGQLYYRTIGKGEPIVLIHGGPGLDHSYFLPVMDTLAEDHLVVYYDQRGSGKSQCIVNCETVNMDKFVSDLEALRIALDLETLTLVGHSWGSLLAIEYTLAFPKRVKSLILLHSLPPTSKGLEKYYENLDLLLKPISDQLAKIELSEDFKHGQLDAVRNYLDLILQKFFYDENKILLLNTHLSQNTASNFFKIGELIDSDYLGDYDLTKQLNLLNVPTLILHGDNDPVPVKFAVKLNREIKNSRYLEIKNSGHFSFIEQPVIFFREINAFLSQETLKHKISPPH
ncbi:Hydrolase [Chlamydiales bacterium STE3]|nr:Hydrolase [Chlamydiales bacterium STE3]